VVGCQQNSTLEDYTTMEAKITYFDKPGLENTDQTFQIAKERAQQLGIKTIVVATTTGRAAVNASEFFKGMNLVVVSHSAGFKEPNTQEFTEENMKVVRSRNVPVVTAAHAFGGLNRAMRQGDVPQAPATYVIGDIVASTLRIFGQGLKVACEIVLMAADAGLIRTDQEVISIAGVGKSGGADTAIVVKPETAQRFFDLKIKEILCKPR
jgi:hypothetical protein